VKVIADRIAELLAGSGRAFSEAQIARELGCDPAVVHVTLLLDDRFTSRWSVLAESEDGTGEKTRANREAGNTSPAPRADFSPRPSARGTLPAAALGHSLRVNA
jgi:hypothetical protein